MSMIKGMSPGNVGGIAQNVTASPAASSAPGNIDGAGSWTQLVKFVGLARGQDGVSMRETPEVLTASVFAQGIVQSGTSGEGPLLGRAVFGSGNSSPSTVFFDVPFAGNIAEKLWDGGISQSGVLVSVPADVMEISVRNLGNYVPIGGGIALGNAIPILAYANVGIGPRGGGSPLTLTSWAAFFTGAALGPFFMAVPPFAKTFHVFRGSPIGTPAEQVIVTQHTSALAPSDGPYTIAAGSVSPEFGLLGSTNTVKLTPSGGNTLGTLGIVWSLGL